MAKSNTRTCGVCDAPNLKVIGTINVSWTGVTGNLRLQAHINADTGKTCKGEDSKILFRAALKRHNF